MRKPYPNPFLAEALWNELEQYREPLCYDLAGRCFQLVMDNGVTYALQFGASAAALCAGTRMSA